MPKPSAICLGVVVGARGTRGEVRVKSFTAEPRDLVRYGTLHDESGRRQFAVTVVGLVQGTLIVRIAGVEDRNGAEALKGLRLYVERSALPKPAPDEYYQADLVGLAVHDRSGQPVGTVAMVEDYGAGAILEVKRMDGSSVIVPFTRASVPTVALEAGFVVIDPPTEVEARADAPVPEAKP